jgi:hypothetical protein
MKWIEHISFQIFKGLNGLVTNREVKFFNVALIFTFILFELNVCAYGRSYSI